MIALRFWLRSGSARWMMLAGVVAGIFALTSRSGWFWDHASAASWAVTSTVLLGPLVAGLVAHVSASVLGLASFLTYVLTDAVLWAWAAFVLIAIGNTFGDMMLLRRTRAMGGSHLSTINAYKLALRSMFKGRLPLRVSFHAMFAGVVFFSTLAVCIVETVS